MKINVHLCLGRSAGGGAADPRDLVCPNTPPPRLLSLRLPPTGHPPRLTAAGWAGERSRRRRRRRPSVTDERAPPPHGSSERALAACECAVAVAAGSRARRPRRQGWRQKPGERPPALYIPHETALAAAGSQWKSSPESIRCGGSGRFPWGLQQSPSSSPRRLHWPATARLRHSPPTAVTFEGGAWPLVAHEREMRDILAAARWSGCGAGIHPRVVSVSFPCSN